MMHLDKNKFNLKLYETIMDKISFVGNGLKPLKKKLLKMAEN